MTDLNIEAVQALLDKQAIKDQLMLYSRSMDRRDFDLANSVYWPDAVDDKMH